MRQQNPITSFQEVLSKQWKYSDPKNSFSLEKLIFAFFQVLDLAQKLLDLDIYAYSEINLDKLCLLDNFELKLNSNLSQSYKLFELNTKFKSFRKLFSLEYIVKGPNFEENEEENDEIIKRYIALNLYRINGSSFQYHNLSESPRTLYESLKLQISLLFQQILVQFGEQLQNQSWQDQLAQKSEKLFKNYIGQVLKAFQEILEELKYDQLLKKEELSNYAELLAKKKWKEKLQYFYDQGTFYQLQRRLYSEGQYKAVIYILKYFADNTLCLYSPEVLGNRYQLYYSMSLIAAKSMIKLKSKYQHCLDLLHQLKANVLERKGEGSDELIPILTKLGKVCYRMNKLDRSIEEIHYAQFLIERFNSQRHHDLAKCYYLKFKVAWKRNELDEALELLDFEAEEIRQDEKGSFESKKLGRNFKRKGEVMMEMKQTKKAEFYFEDYNRIYQNQYGRFHPKSLKSLKALSLAQIKNHRYKEALNNLKTLLYYHEKQLSPIHFEVFLVLKFMGQCHRELFEYSESIQCLARAKEIGTQIFLVCNTEVMNEEEQAANAYGSLLKDTDVDYFQLAEIELNIGLVKFQGEKDYASAEGSFKIAAKLLKKVKHLDQKFLVECQYWHGMSMLKLDKHDEGREELQQAIQFYQKADKSNLEFFYEVKDAYQATVTSLDQQQKVFETIDALKKWASFIRQAIEAAPNLEQYSKEIELARAFQTLVGCYIEADEVKFRDQIVDHHLQTLMILEKMPKDNKGWLLEVNLKLAKIYVDGRMYQKALKYGLKAKDIYDNVKGVKEEKVGLDILLMLGQIHYKLGNSKISLEVYRQILNSPNYLNLFHQRPLDIQFSLHLRIALLLEQYAYFKQSINLYEQALSLHSQLQQQELPSSSSQKVPILNGLAFCKNKVGDFEMAINYTKELLSLNKELYGLHNPQVMSSLISLVALYRKLLHLNAEQKESLQRIKDQLIDVISLMLERFTKKGKDLSDNTGDNQLELFKEYIMNYQTVGILNHAFVVEGEPPTKFSFIMEQQEEGSKVERMKEVCRVFMKQEVVVSARLVEEEKQQSKGKKKGKKGKKTQQVIKGLLQEGS